MNFGSGDRAVTPVASLSSHKSWNSSRRGKGGFREVTGKLSDLRRSIEEAHDREVNKLREDLSRLRTELTRAVERLGQLKDKDRTRKRALLEADKGHEEEGRFAPLVRTPRGAITRSPAVPSLSDIAGDVMPVAEDSSVADDVHSDAAQSREWHSERPGMLEIASTRTWEVQQQCSEPMYQSSAADFPMASTLTEEYQKIAATSQNLAAADEPRRPSLLSRMLEMPLRRLYGSRNSEASARNSQVSQARNSQASERNSQVSSFSALGDLAQSPATPAQEPGPTEPRPLPEEANKLPALRESIESGESVPASLESTAGEDSHRLDQYGQATAQEGNQRRISMGSLTSFQSEENFRSEESEYAPKFLLRDVWHLRERRSSRFMNQGTEGKGSIRRARAIALSRTTSSLAPLGGLTTAFSLKLSSHGLDGTPGGLLFLAHEQITKLHCIVHPQSRVRIMWDILSMFLLLFDFVTIPLQLFELEGSGVLTTMGLASTVFWTLDMVMSSITGVYVKEVLVMRLRAILYHYSRTWLSLDVSLVVLDWVMIAQGDKDSQQGVNAAGTFRLLKMLRFLRLLRLLKAAKFVNVLEAMTNSNIVILGLSIVKHMVQLLMANHLIACAWYELGKRTNGWVFRDFSESDDVPYRYLTSLHWSITQFHGTMEVNPVNAAERIFTNCVLFVALIGMAAFISSITNMMIQVQNLGVEKTKFEQAFRTYLQKNKVSLSLTLRMKNYIQRAWAGKESLENEALLLKQLPEELQMDLCAEIRFPIVSVHPFLAEYHASYPRNVRRLCHEAMTATMMQQDEEVFHSGDVGSHMIFVGSGSLQYTMMNDVKMGPAYTWVKSVRSTAPMQPQSRVMEPVMIQRDAWVAEAVVWTSWVHVGDLICKFESSFVLVDATEFARLISTHRPAHLEASRYAREFIMYLNDHPSDLLRAPRGWAPVYI